MDETGETHSPEAEAVASHVDDVAASVVDQAHAIAGESIDNSADAAAAAAAAAEHASGAQQVAEDAAAQLREAQGALDWQTRNEANIQAIRAQMEAMPEMVQSQIAAAIAEMRASQIVEQPTPVAALPLDPEGGDPPAADEAQVDRDERPTMRPKEKKRKWI